MFKKITPAVGAAIGFPVAAAILLVVGLVYVSSSYSSQALLNRPITRPRPKVIQPTPSPTTVQPQDQVLDDGTIIKASGILVLPDGTQVKPDGTVIKPDGTVVKPK